MREKWLTPTTVTRSATVHMAAKWRLNLRKLIEFAHGRFWYNFLRKLRWTVVTDFVEWNSSTQIAYWYYCPTLITALKLSVLSQTLSAELPSNHQNNIKRHESKKSCRSETVANLKKKKQYLHFLLQIVSPTDSVSIVLELWITLYMCAKGTHTHAHKHTVFAQVAKVVETMIERTRVGLAVPSGIHSVNTQWSKVQNIWTKYTSSAYYILPRGFKCSSLGGGHA
jgi:hypothetical protein